jgi:hypothetical protein
MGWHLKCRESLRGGLCQGREESAALGAGIFRIRPIPPPFSALQRASPVIPAQSAQIRLHSVKTYTYTKTEQSFGPWQVQTCFAHKAQ